MSVELCAFMERSRLPSREQWQATIGQLEIPIEISPGELADCGGYWPFKLEGQESGVEVDLFESDEYPEDLLEQDPSLEEDLKKCDVVVVFRWSSEFDSCACALGAAAALSRGFGARVASEEEEGFTSADQLLAEFKECLPDARKDLKNR